MDKTQIYLIPLLKWHAFCITKAVGDYYNRSLRALDTIYYMNVIFTVNIWNYRILYPLVNSKLELYR